MIRTNLPPGTEIKCVNKLGYKQIEASQTRQIMRCVPTVTGAVDMTYPAQVFSGLARH